MRIFTYMNRRQRVRNNNFGDFILFFRCVYMVRQDSELETFDICSKYFDALNNSMTHQLRYWRVTLCFTQFFKCICFRLAWSVRIVNQKPSLYALNTSTLWTTAWHTNSVIKLLRCDLFNFSHVYANFPLQHPIFEKEHCTSLCYSRHTEWRKSCWCQISSKPELLLTMTIIHWEAFVLHLSNRTSFFFDVKSIIDAAIVE